jgi:hypothetical protein
MIFAKIKKRLKLGGRGNGLSVLPFLFAALPVVGKDIA